MEWTTSLNPGRQQPDSPRVARVVLVDRSGERIDVTSHLLRHAAATVQRHQYGVPLEILAEAMGHTLSADGQVSEATRYYSQITDVQKAEIRHEAVVAMMDDAGLALRVIEPEEEAARLNRLISEADERTREVLERYGGLHPVTFGHRGYPGLRVRGTARAFCIGLPVASGAVEGRQYVVQQHETTRYTVERTRRTRHLAPALRQPQHGPCH